MFLHWEIYFEFECHSPQSNQSISISTFKWTDILECFEIVILFKWTIILFCKCNVLLHSSIPQKSWNLTCKQYFISQVRITPNQGAARHQIWCPKLVQILSCSLKKSKCKKIFNVIFSPNFTSRKSQNSLFSFFWKFKL